MTAIYVATRVITFFGTEMRTFWEHLVCRIYGIAVEDTRSFKNSELCGHVEHELTETRGAAFMMCWLPLTMNFFLSLCFLLTGSYRIFYIGDLTSYMSYIYLWLGLSFAANCFPSFEDALSFKDAFYARKGGMFLKIVLAPLFALVYVGALLERYSITFLIAIAFSVFFPYITEFIFPIINQIIK